MATHISPRWCDKATRRHHRQGQEEVCTEDAVGPIMAERQVARRVERAEEKQHRYEAQHDLAQGIQQQPVLQAGDRHTPAREDDGPHDQGKVSAGPQRQQPGPPAIGGHGERHGRHEQGKGNQEVDHRCNYSLSSERCSVLVEANSRLIWWMMMPITNTPVKRSKSTPTSTKNGMASKSNNPKRKIPFSKSR